MQISNKHELKQILETQKNWAFVPTMGALHEGHLSLIRQAKEKYQHVICSIFVNPTQFNRLEDYQKYPKTLEDDLFLLKKEACDLVFTPNLEEIYANNEIKINKNYDFGNLEKVMEGKMRPGHYQGVAHIVRVLLEIIQPQALYLGEKDFQQIAIIKKMLEIEKMLIPVHIGSTVRERSGLAMSSRNRRLSEKGLEIAENIYKILTFSQKNKGLNPKDLLKKVKEEANQIPEMIWEYIEIHPEDELERVVETWEKDKNYRIFCAALIENVRLIDNILL